MNNTYHDLNIDMEMNAITNPYERAIAKDAYAQRFIMANIYPPKQGKFGDSWDNAGRELEALGIKPESYTIKMWFYPVQTFLKIYNSVYFNYPDVGPEARVSIAYYNWLGAYVEPQNEPDKTIYQIKKNTLKEFLNSIGYSSAWKKAEAEISRQGQAAQAQAQAAAAARAYEEAKRKQAEEAEKINNGVLDEKPANLLPIVAGALLILFVLRRRK